MTRRKKIPQNNCWPNVLSINSTSTTMESTFDVLVYVPLTNLSQRKSNTMYFHLRVQSAQLAIQPKQDVYSYLPSTILKSSEKKRKYIWRWHRFYSIFMSNVKKKRLLSLTPKKNPVKTSTQRLRTPQMAWLKVRKKTPGKRWSGAAE